MSDSQSKDKLELNKEVVLKFYHDVFRDHNLELGISGMREDYVQHNPAFRTGKKGFTEAFGAMLSETVPIPDQPDEENQCKSDGDLFVQNLKIGFMKYFRNGCSDFEIKRVIVEDDLVVLHAHFNLPDPRYPNGVALVDIFRVKNGMVAEHWDVVQPIPQETANDNTMF